MFISIYNDQGGASRRWLWIKRWYNHSWAPVQTMLVLAVGAWFEVCSFLARLARFENPLPFRDWEAKKKTRGMSVWHDIIPLGTGNISKERKKIDRIMQEAIAVIKERRNHPSIYSSRGFRPTKL